MALQEVGNAQHYPQCVNLQISGSGSDSRSGVLGTELCRANEPGITVDIYENLTAYVIPGPKLITGGVAGVPPGLIYAGEGKSAAQEVGGIDPKDPPSSASTLAWASPTPLALQIASSTSLDASPTPSPGTGNTGTSSNGTSGNGGSSGLSSDGTAPGGNLSDGGFGGAAAPSGRFVVGGFGNAQSSGAPKANFGPMRTRHWFGRLRERT